MGFNITQTMFTEVHVPVVSVYIYIPLRAHVNVLESLFSEILRDLVTGYGVKPIRNKPTEFAS